MIRLFCWLKVNSIGIEILVSQALIGMEICDAEFNTI